MSCDDFACCWGALARSHLNLHVIYLAYLSRLIYIRLSALKTLDCSAHNQDTQYNSCEIQKI